MKKKLTVEQVLYCREHYLPGDAANGLKGLAQKFDVSRDVIKDAVHGVTYKDVGGTIHPAKERVPAEVKAQIATSGLDVEELAARYGISQETVQKFLPKPRGRRAKVTDDIKAAVLDQYEPYSKDGSREALAQKFGVSTATIGNILKESRSEPARRGRQPALVPDFMKEAIIVACDEEHLSVRALSERFSLSRPVIKSVLTEAGIEVRKRQVVDDDTKSEIIDAFKAGQSLRQLEEIYGVNRATIAGWVEGFRPSKPKKELTQELREQIYRYHSQGYGSTIIAKTVGLSQQIVRKVIDGEL